MRLKPSCAGRRLPVDRSSERDRVELERGDIVADTIEDARCIFLKGLHASEQAIARRLADLAAGPAPWPAIDLDKAVPWIEKRTGKALAPSQIDAVRLVLASKVAVITGGPGTGKTTLLDAILRILVAKGVRVLLAAPTGRAAKRMTEQTGIEAKTLHRLLEVDPANGGFKKGLEMRASRFETRSCGCSGPVFRNLSIFEVSTQVAGQPSNPAMSRSSSRGGQSRKQALRPTSCGSVPGR